MSITPPSLCLSALIVSQAGADELDPDAYRAACDLRARLSDASKSRSALDTAVRALTVSLARPDDAAAVERAVADAARALA